MNSMLTFLSSPTARSGRVALLLAGAFTILAVGCGTTSDASETPANTPARGPAAAVVNADFRVRSELVFGARADLSFQLPGEVGAVNVSVGDLVSAGDVLATIDVETINDLKYAEAQAKYKLEQAQDVLDRDLGLQSPDPLVRARAESDLSRADVALEKAEDALIDYQLDYDVALGAARKAVADAESAVDSAEDAVTDFAERHSETFAAALAATTAARTKLDRARDVVTDFLPLHNESVAGLEASIADTENRLDAARTTLRDFDATHANRLADARQKLAQAEAQLEAAQDAFTEFHIKVIDGQFNSLRDGRNFDVVQFNALQSAVAVARRGVDFWEQEIDELESGPKEFNRSAAMSRVDRLQSELDRLNRRLQEELAGPDQDELAHLEANVLVAQEELERAERDLAEVEQGVDRLELARLQAATDNSRVALESAQAKLARLEEGIDETVLADLAQSVTAAREARDELADGPDSAVIALRQANLDAAGVDYAEIQEDLALTEIRAPFAGLIKLVTIAPDDVITVDARVIQLVDPKDVTILGMVETNHIDRISAGAPASVTLGELPGITFDARVAEISGEARTERGVVSFPVVFNVQVPPDVNIPPNPGLVTTTVLVGDGAPPRRPGR